MGILAQMYASELADLESAGKIDHVGKLKIYRYTSLDSPCVKIWRGKASKPFINYRFRSDAARESSIARAVDNEAVGVAYLEKRKAERKESAAKMVASINVGDLLHYSWGYEQTNCDYYQVTEKRGSMVTVRAIAGKMVPDSGRTNGMACMMQPIRDSFLEGHQAETLTKRIGPYGIAMDHGSASPCTEFDRHYCSWYA